MGEVDGYLTLCIYILNRLLIVILWYYPSDSKLSGDAEGDGPYDCSRTEICQMIAMPTNTLLRTTVRVDNSRVGNPSFWRLILELLTPWVTCLDPLLDLGVDCFFNFGFHLEELRCYPPYILNIR